MTPKSSNSMRTHLITKFTCTGCGNLLNLSYHGPDKSSPPCSDDEPTGAAMVEQRVWVEPCRTCLKPQKDVVQAAKAFVAMAERQQVDRNG